MAEMDKALIPDRLMGEIRVLSACEDALDLPGFPCYAITATGQVWSIKGRGVQLVAKHPRLLKTKWHKGSPYVILSYSNIGTSVSISRALALAFISPPPFEGAQGVFIDGNPHNMTPGNVKWATPSERTFIALGVHGVQNQGERQGSSVLTDADVLEMRHLFGAGEATVSELALQKGVGVRTARRAIRKQSWKHLKDDAS